MAAGPSSMTARLCLICRCHAAMSTKVLSPWWIVTTPAPRVGGSVAAPIVAHGLFGCRLVLCGIGRKAAECRH
jgi:hypothetical protein